jgi:hypothetical protein
VDNSAVSVNPLQRDDEKLNSMNPYVDTDEVRVSIVLEKASTIKAGFSTMGIAENASAMSYRDTLKRDQDAMVQKIETAIRGEIVERLAKKYDAVYIPLQERLDKAAGEHPEWSTPAGVHPSPAGHQIIADAWLAAFPG